MLVQGVSLTNLPRRVCRRLHASLLRTRIAQLRAAAQAVACRSAAESLYQSQLLGQAADARLQLFRLDQLP